MKHANSRYLFVLVHDPDEYPLCPGLSLTLREVLFCLRNHSFTPGTVIRDQLAGVDHTVVRVRRSLTLNPPSQRIDRYTLTIANINRRSKSKIKTRDVLQCPSRLELGEGSKITP